MTQAERDEMQRIQREWQAANDYQLRTFEAAGLLGTGVDLNEGVAAMHKAVEAAREVATDHGHDHGTDDAYVCLCITCDLGRALAPLNALLKRPR